MIQFTVLENTDTIVHRKSINQTFFFCTTVGAQSIARAQSIAPRHSTYVIMPKKPKFRKFLFGKIKKEEFARRFFKKKQCIFAFKIVK